jgi:hypothetical protein
VGHDALVELHFLEDLLTVDGEGHRLAKVLVVERLLGQVHGQAAPVAAHGRVDVELGVLAEVGHELGRHVVDAVHLAGLERGHQGGRLDDELQQHLVEVGELAAGGVRLPVVRVPLQQDVVRLLPLHEFEGAGAHRVAAVGPAPLLDGARVQDGRRPPGRAREGHAQEGVRFHEAQLESVGVQDVDRLQQLELPGVDG